MYWKLDDPTGPAASDSSGNGHPGAYGGVFSLGYPGPEAGTFAAYLDVGGSVALSPGPINSRNSQTFCICLSHGPTFPGVLTPFAYIGDGLKRGNGIRLLTPDIYQCGTWQIGGNISGSSNYSMSCWNRWWHFLTVTVDTAVNSVQLWDGGSSVKNVATGQSTFTGPDAIEILGDNPLVVSHFAAWQRALSAAEIASYANQVPQWPPGPLSGPISTDVTTIVNAINGGIATDLSRLIADVERTYP